MERNGNPPDCQDQIASAGPYEEFKPTLAISVVWTVLATVMTVAGFILFALVHTQVGGTLGGDGSLVEYGSDNDTLYFSLRLGGMVALLAVVIGALLVHEAIHGLGFWYFGGRPTFGATIVQKILPVLYCSAPGYQFSRAQFSVIILAPLVVISLVGILLMPFVNNGMLLVTPLAVNFGGAIGDVWMFGMILRRKSGTMIEDLKDGLRFHPPEARRAG